MRNECLLLGFWCLLACSDEEADKATRTREDFCREWATRACSPETVSRCQAASAEACRVTQQAFCSNLVPESFSGERSDECLAAVGSAYTDGDLTSQELRTVLRLDTPCNHLVRGPKQRGASCADTRECNTAGGLECIKKAGSATGACEVPEIIAAGLKCDAPQHVCIADFYCNGDNCIATKDVGDACTSLEECGDDNYCDEAGTCVARASVNTACTQDFECGSNVCYMSGPGDQVCIDRLVLARSDPACAALR